jgi:hypothetical protein
MANIRASVVVSTALSVALSVGSVTASAIPNSFTAVASPNISIAASIQLIPLREFEQQTVTPSDTVSSFSIGKVLVDISTATESVAISFSKQLTDSVTVTDVIGKMFLADVDFDMSDPDVDPDPITVADESILSIGKSLIDVSAISEADVKNVGKSFSETLLSSDESFTNVGKNLDNTVTASEESTFAIDVQKTDLATVSESHEVEFTKGNISDAVESNDLASLNAGLNKNSSITAQDELGNFVIGKNPSDTAATDDDTKVFSVDKVLADSVTAIDAITRHVESEVDFDRTDTDVDPDPVSVADAAAYSVGVTKVDAITSADTVVMASGKVFTDAVSISETFEAILTLGDSMPLYDFAFIADDKYTYFPVPGTLNNHMIHQPLLNGEFVLTTDPNAGIVYTIRPEAISYTFGWYGINENQFN